MSSLTRNACCNAGILQAIAQSAPAPRGTSLYQDSRLPSNCRCSNCWESFCLHSNHNSRVQGKCSRASVWLLQGQLWQFHLLLWALQRHIADSKSAQVEALCSGSSSMCHLAAPQYAVFSRACLLLTRVRGAASHAHHCGHGQSTGCALMLQAGQHQACSLAKTIIVFALKALPATRAGFGDNEVGDTALSPSIAAARP